VLKSGLADKQQKIISGIFDRENVDELIKICQNFVPYGDGDWCKYDAWHEFD